MNKKQSYKTWVSVLLGFLLLLFVFGSFMIHRPVTHSSDHALTRQEYLELLPGADIPSSASNIWFAMSGVGMGGRASVLKFEAPLADCVTFAKREFHKYAKQLYDDPANYPSEKLVPFIGATEDWRPFLKKAYGLENLDWFDVHGVTNGLTIVRPKAHLPDLRIDVERSTLYSYWTD